MSGAVRLPDAVRPVIFGAAGLALTADERRFFRESQPFGFILFARNIDHGDQIRALVADLRESAGYDAPVLIDQEGGRVARLRNGLAHNLPPMARIGELADAQGEAAASDAAWLVGRLLAHDLAQYDIWVDCIPVLDVPVAGAHDVIGDRAFAREAGLVARLGRAAALGALAGGCLPVIKHIPGHGRAGVDSHLSLPVVDASFDDLAASDFPPFSALADMPMAMTAHVRYSAIDADLPATLSPAVIEQIIRKLIGFNGLLMTDDLSMGALGGTLEDRARLSLAAGCDLLLHCNGVMAEMQAVMAADPQFSGIGQTRAQAALDARQVPSPADAADLVAKLNQYLPGLVS
jgi:beta-N-acetylhexosaminidase